MHECVLHKTRSQVKVKMVVVQDSIIQAIAGNIKTNTTADQSKRSLKIQYNNWGAEQSGQELPLMIASTMHLDLVVSDSNQKQENED